jgi:protein O-GlcNAc transferase
MSLSVDKALRQAQSHLKVGELAEAEALYKQVLSKFPKNKKAIQGYQKLKAGITSKGSLNSEPPQEQIDELISIYNQGQFEEVLSKAKPLISLFPKAAILHNLQGASNAALQKYDAAIDSYQQALKIKPDFAEAHNNMGNALTDKGELDAAINRPSRSSLTMLKPIAIWGMP